MSEFSVISRQPCEMVDITCEINAVLPAGLNGVCLVFCRHTTAALTVNENADPAVTHDLLAKLDRLLPERESYYRHGEGNSAAHLKSSLLGASLQLPVRGGRLDLGAWQGVYLCEFDGPRSRRITVSCWSAES